MPRPACRSCATIRAPSMGLQGPCLICLFPVLHMAHNRLPAAFDIRSLDPDSLPPLAAISLHALQLHVIGRGQLVQCRLGCIPLPQVVRKVRAPGQCHGCLMDRRHLHQRQRLHSISPGRAVGTSASKMPAHLPYVSTCKDRSRKTTLKEGSQPEAAPWAGSQRHLPTSVILDLRHTLAASVLRPSRNLKLLSRMRGQATWQQPLTHICGP